MPGTQGARLHVYVHTEAMEREGCKLGGPEFWRARGLGPATVLCGCRLVLSHGHDFCDGGGEQTHCFLSRGVHMCSQQYCWGGLNLNTSFEIITTYSPG